MTPLLFSEGEQGTCDKGIRLLSRSNSQGQLCIQFQALLSEDIGLECKQQGE